MEKFKKFIIPFLNIIFLAIFLMAFIVTSPLIFIVLSCVYVYKYIKNSKITMVSVVDDILDYISQFN